MAGSLADRPEPEALGSPDLQLAPVVHGSAQHIRDGQSGDAPHLPGENPTGIDPEADPSYQGARHRNHGRRTVGQETGEAWGQYRGDAVGSPILQSVHGRPGGSFVNEERPDQKTRLEPHISGAAQRPGATQA